MQLFGCFKSGSDPAEVQLLNTRLFQSSSVLSYSWLCWLTLWSCHPADGHLRLAGHFEPSLVLEALDGQPGGPLQLILPQVCPPPPWFPALLPSPLLTAVRRVWASSATKY